LQQWHVRKSDFDSGVRRSRHLVQVAEQSKASHVGACSGFMCGKACRRVLIRLAHAPESSGDSDTPGGAAHLRCEKRARADWLRQHQSLARGEPTLT
jgi:hypothetical protein